MSRQLLGVLRYCALLKRWGIVRGPCPMLCPGWWAAERPGYFRGAAGEVVRQKRCRCGLHLKPKG
jgi:hypothetical protein